MDDGIQIDFQGDDALGRTMRTIIMIADGAISTLVDLGWTRNAVRLIIDQKDPLPCWVTIRKKKVFEIRLTTDPDGGRISVDGIWLEHPRAPGIIDRFWGV